MKRCLSRQFNSLGVRLAILAVVAMLWSTATVWADTPISPESFGNESGQPNTPSILPDTSLPGAMPNDGLTSPAAQENFWREVPCKFDLRDAEGRHLPINCASLSITMQLPTGAITFADGKTKVAMGNNPVFELSSKNHSCKAVQLRFVNGQVETVLYAPKKGKQVVKYSLQFVADPSDPASEAYRGNSFGVADPSKSRTYNSNTLELNSSIPNISRGLYLKQQHRSMAEYAIAIGLFLVIFIGAYQATMNAMYDGLLLNRDFDFSHEKASSTARIHFIFLLLICTVLIALGLFFPAVEGGRFFDYYQLCLYDGCAVLLLVCYCFYAMSVKSK